MALIARSIDAAGLDLPALVEGAVVPDLYAARNDFVLATVALRCPVSALYRRTWLAQEA